MVEVVEAEVNSMAVEVEVRVKVIQFHREVFMDKDTTGEEQRRLVQ